MSGAAGNLLAGLPDHAFGFVVVLARVGGAVSVLPGLGEGEIPTTVKAGVALMLSGLVLPVVESRIPGAGLPPLAMLAMIASELFCGLLLGWLARLIALALPVAGQLLAVQVGLSSVLQPDPDLGSQTAGTSRLLALAAPVLILSSGLYALPIRALVGSYRLFPPGTLPSVADAADSVAQATSGSFALALQLAAPLVLGGMIWQVMLALVARLVPSLQVYSMSLPGQVLGGLVILTLVLQEMLRFWLTEVGTTFSTLPGS